MRFSGPRPVHVVTTKWMPYDTVRSSCLLRHWTLPAHNVHQLRNTFNVTSVQADSIPALMIVFKTFRYFGTSLEIVGHDVRVHNSPIA
jgi:hypothetical protein